MELYGNSINKLNVAWTEIQVILTHLWPWWVSLQILDDWLFFLSKDLGLFLMILNLYMLLGKIKCYIFLVMILVFINFILSNITPQPLKTLTLSTLDRNNLRQCQCNVRILRLRSKEKLFRFFMLSMLSIVWFMRWEDSTIKKKIV